MNPKKANKEEVVDNSTEYEVYNYVLTIKVALTIFAIVITAIVIGLIYLLK